MQELHATEQTHFASLSLRCAAIAIDTVVLFTALVVIFSIAAATGALNVNDPAFSGGLSLSRTAPAWLYLITYGLVFVYYTLFEALTQASVGKLALGMRVTMDDGTRPTGVAIVLRNLIRLPEILFWYIPSGISCLTNTRNKRLGDLAARTVVLRRGAAPAIASAALSTSRMPAAAAPPPAPGPAPQPPSSPDLTASIAAFKTAALAVAGAHRSYLHFSELELAAADRPADEAHDYSPEYIAAWYTLADTVVAAQKKLAVAESAASGAGTTLQEACADQPDLVRAVREFGPYFGAASDDQIHDAYLRVARAETAT